MTPTNTAYWSAGSSIFQSIFGAIGAGNVADATKEAALANIEINKNNYLRSIVSATEQTQAIERELGHALSARGLEAMKAEAKLRTAGASTGLAGAGIEEVANQAKYDELFDAQILISRARKSEANIQRQRLADYMSFVSQGQQTVSSMPTSAGAFGALAAGFTSGLGVYTDYVKAGGKDFIGNSIADLISGTYSNKQYASINFDNTGNTRGL